MLTRRRWTSAGGAVFLLAERVLKAWLVERGYLAKPE